MNDWIIGAVLAGGGSRRMGRDKALLSFGGKPLIERTARLMQSIFSRVLLVAGRREYKFLGLPVVPDSFPNSGPLGGIHTALLKGNGQPVFVVACDLPFVNRELIEYIVDFPFPENGHSPSPERPNEAMLAKIPVQRERLQPLCGLYFPGCLGVIEQGLNQRELKAVDILKELSIVRVPITSKQSFYKDNLFRNVNTPHEYQVAMAEVVVT